jgi:hypothetical protein
VLAIKKSTKRWLGAIFAVLFCLWLGFLGYVGWAMGQPPEVFGRVMAKMPTPAYFIFPFETMWLHARKGSLEPGGTAPDFAVEKPVVLVFGSYT